MSLPRIGARDEWLAARKALLEHHISLGVKFTKHRSKQTLRFHPHPKLQFIGGHGNEISGEVGGRESVHARSTSRSVDAIKLVLHQHLALLRDQLVELLLQFPV